MSGFYRKLVEEADRISSNSKNLFEQASGVEEAKQNDFNYRMVDANGLVVERGTLAALQKHVRSGRGVDIIDPKGVWVTGPRKGKPAKFKKVKTKDYADTPSVGMKAEEVEQVDEKFKRYKDEAPSAEDVANVKKDFADMVKVFKKKIAKMERTEAKLKEKLRTAKTPKIKANLEDRLYTETHSIKWHKEWLRDAEAKAKKGIEKGDYDTIESAVDDLGAFAWDDY